MEEAKGVQLSNVWEDMEIDDQAKVVRSIIEIEAKFLMASMDRYASTYVFNTISPLTKDSEQERYSTQRTCRVIVL